MIDIIHYIISNAPEAPPFLIPLLAIDGAKTCYDIWKEITPKMKRKTDDDARNYLVNECLQGANDYLQPHVRIIVDYMFDSLDAYDEDRVYNEMYSLIMAVREHEDVDIAPGC
jgi:hypothetical protein